MNDRADDIHEWDAAYVLGSLSATDRALFESHLEGCDACMRSLAELSGLPGVLRMLPVEEAIALMDEPEAPAVPQPVALAQDAPGHRVPRRGRRPLAGAARRPLSRRTGGWILAAAAVVLLVGGAGLGSALRAGVSGPVADPSPASSSAAGDLSEGLPADAVSMRSDLDEGVTAKLALTSQPWGTRFDWSCEYAGGGVGQGAYDLVAIEDDGTRTVVATWGAGQAESRLLAATSSLPMDRIRTVQITPSDSDVVLASRDL
ncbi:anti-sigma factor family protein [Clavibacter michiganensis]|uniref:anti-sigma factor family protein n=1 Tax=Clavibacter michiganensis TaxID=28447 RepID=UPI003EBD5D4E